MNKRIEELAEQAGFVDYTVHNRLESKEQVLEKFAELIVQECADIAKHHVMNISTYADAEFVEEQVKQHFGVEQ